MKNKVIIMGRLIGLNEYTNLNRYSKYAGSDIKKEMETIIRLAIRTSNTRKVENYPIKLSIKWYEQDKRRDVDNITFAVKFILDALVNNSILIDDSRRYVTRIEHDVLVDKKSPRIEVEIVEIEGLKDGKR